MREGLGLGALQGVQGLRGGEQTAGLPDRPGAMQDRAWPRCRGPAGGAAWPAVACRESRWLPLPSLCLRQLWAEQAGRVRWEGRPVATHGPQVMQAGR